MVVHELRDSGASYRRIKTAIRELRERYGTDWPLTRASLATSKGHIYDSSDDALYDVSARGYEKQQLHLEEDDLTRIAGLLERGGWAARELPDLRNIEVNPDRLSGRPTIRGRRIPADKVARLAEAHGAEVVGQDYDLTDEEIHDARRWWEKASTFEEAA